MFEMLLETKKTQPMNTRPIRCERHVIWFFVLALVAPLTTVGQEGVGALNGPTNMVGPQASEPSNLLDIGPTIELGEGVAANGPAQGLPESTALGSDDAEFVPSWPIENPVQSSPAAEDFVPSSAPIGCGPTPGCGIGPKSPRRVFGFHCVGESCSGPPAGNGVWDQAGPIPWQAFGPGEYVGPARRAHVGDYRVRVDDVIEFVFRVTGQAVAEGYRLKVGDEMDVACAGGTESVVVRSDGTLRYGQVGEVQAAGRSLAEIQREIEVRLASATVRPCVTLLPRRLNHVFQSAEWAKWPEMKSRQARVTPAGDVQLPVIGSVAAQGLTLNELKREVESAYRSSIGEVEVTPILAQRAQRFVYVVGEVAQTGRFEMTGPTTLMQAIAMAGGNTRAADLKQVVVFRRDENWDLMATRINLACALQGRDPCPAGEIWLRDSDIVLVPRTRCALEDMMGFVFGIGDCCESDACFDGCMSTL